MGLFSKKPSGSEIEQKVRDLFNHRLLSPRISTPEFDTAYDEVLQMLSEWAAANKLGSWKMSTIMGSIEAIFRHQLSQYTTEQEINRYVRIASGVFEKSERP